MASDWKIDVRGFKELKKSFADAPRKLKDVERAWLKDVAAEQAKGIAKAAPKKTGALRNSIRPYSRDFVAGVQFQPDLKYRKFVIEGTRPHIIRAKGKALHFIWKGKERFYKAVHHPGTKANDFVREGSVKSDAKVRAWLADLSKRLVKAFS